MKKTSIIDYSVLDRPEVLLFLFHPRPEPHPAPGSPADPDTLIQRQRDFLIPVASDAAVGARFHMAEKSACNLLFFHGNGEIVADYDDLGPAYNAMGINFLAVDYRGYGRSTGKPTVTAMMQDCHVIFDFVEKWLAANNFPGPRVLMGRSLGSAPALELAATHQNRVDGLIVESGFAYAAPLLRLLGINPQNIGFKEEKGFRNIDKIAKFNKPTLIIHAERDHIIPFADGQALYNASPDPDKILLKIPLANHNDIFMRARPDYLAAIKQLTARITKTKAA